MADTPKGRYEDLRLTTGRGRFTGDIAVDGALHAVFVRAPQAAGRLVALDVSEARAAPGVVAVLTHAELEADGVAPFVAPLKLEGPDGRVWTETPRPLLIGAAFRHVGEPVALVIAETPAQAQDAAEMVEFDVEEVPAAATLEAVLAPDAPAVWDHAPDNRALHWRRGDWDAVGAALEDAHHVARLEGRISRVMAAPMEPRVALAVPGADRVTLYASLQNSPAIRGALAKMLAIDPATVHVVAPDVGGSFGMKSGPLREECAVFWAARRLGRPVRWQATRMETFLSDEAGRDMMVSARLGLDAEGIFTALQVTLTVNVGAYASGRSTPPTLNLGGIAGVYRTPRIAGEIIGLFSHSAPTAPYRGAGRPEASYALERVIDIAAREMGIDPFELRRRNLVPTEAMPYRTPFIFTYDSGDFARTMRLASERADVAGFPARKAEAAARGKLRGIGVCNPIEVAGGPFGRPGRDFASVRIHEDGTIAIGSGVLSAGQGLETAMTRLAAEALGLAPERFTYSQGDTDVSPQGKGMGGSAAMTTGASALKIGIERVLDKAKELAAEELEAAVADLEYREGAVRVAGTDRAISLGRLAELSEASGRGPLAAEGDFQPEDATYPNGCHIVEVEIDPETGRCAFIGYWAVEDIGTVLFEQLAEGQVMGGAAQGLGQALCEDVRYDETGQVLSASFMDYAMPRADDLPPYDCAFAATPTTLNPLGVKGVGEAGTVGALAAGANAICDALAAAGVEHFDMPASPHRVWEALQAAKTGA